MTERSTKDRLADAFIELAAHKSLDKITIKDLVGQCNVSRQSFYYYYQDILEVVEWIVHRKADDLLKECLTAQTSKEALRIFVDFVVDNKSFIPYLLSSKNREFIERLLTDTLRTFLREMLLYKASEIPIHFAGADIDTIISFYAYGLSGLLLEKSQKRDVDRELLTEQLECLLPGRRHP